MTGDLDWGDIRSPFVDAMGLELVEVGADRVVATLDAGPRHHQPEGIVHGGVWTAVVETLGSVGGAKAVWDDGRTVVGVHNATDFLRPHVAGPVTAVGEPLHLGRTQQLWSVVVTRDDDDKVVARGQLRVAVIDRDRPGPPPDADPDPDPDPAPEPAPAPEPTEVPQ